VFTNIKSANHSEKIDSPNQIAAKYSSYTVTTVFQSCIVDLATPVDIVFPECFYTFLYQYFVKFTMDPQVGPDEKLQQ